MEAAAAWMLGILWALPLLYAVWTAFHPGEYAAHFDPLAPLTLENFARAWEAAPFALYFLNSFLLVTSVLAVQLVLSTLAAFRSEEHTSELQSLMRISYAVFCLKKKKNKNVNVTDDIN